jgi:hypothetical protein
MPYILPEVGYGIGGFESFNCTWQPLFEEIELPQLNQVYVINDIPAARFASAELRNCHRKGVVNINEYPNRKKITIVHEIMHFSRSTLEESDYLVFMNHYQKEIAAIAGINKPCCVLPCHPIPFHMMEKVNKRPRENSVYIGGHFFSCKSNGLVDRFVRLIEKLDQDPTSAGATIVCYFIVAFDYLVEPYKKFKMDVAEHPLLKDRVVFHQADNIPYLTMFENMSACKYTYLWRNELTLEELQGFIERRDSSILYHAVGESSMLANAVAAGCIPIVENNYRFRAYFETDLSYSYPDFVKDLAAFIIRIDNESREPKPGLTCFAINH